MQLTVKTPKKQQLKISGEMKSPEEVEMKNPKTFS